MILAPTGETGKSTAILQDNCSLLPCHQDKSCPAWWGGPNFVGLGRWPFRLAVNGQAQARMRR